MTLQFCDMKSTPNFFDVVFFFFFVNFSYWSKFHVNIITGFGIVTKVLIRNPEMGNTHVQVLPNIWRLVWVIDTKFNTNVSNRILENAAKSQGYGFYCFWVIKGKPIGGCCKITPPPKHTPILGLKLKIRMFWKTSFKDSSWKL